MNRTEATTLINATLPILTDERMDTLLAMLQAWTGPSVFDRLPPAERAHIDRALDRLDAGQLVPAETVFADLAARLKAANPGPSP
jgi:hypothetical protein